MGLLSEVPGFGGGSTAVRVRLIAFTDRNDIVFAAPPFGTTLVPVPVAEAGRSGMGGGRLVGAAASRVSVVSIAARQYPPHAEVAINA